jgi:glycosyltransferase involved in cell wall biosynthesis
VEGYVAKCLDSVISENIKDYEIIVINDGSTDSSKKIVQDYVNRYPHLLRLISIENSGQGQARNVGIEAAQGEFLYFIDSDDYLIPGGIEAIYQLLEQDFDICIFDSIAVNMSGQELEYRCGCKRRENISLAEYPGLLLENPDVWNKIFRRSLFVENNIRFTPRVWFEDLRTVPKLYAFTDRIIYSPQALHRYLQRPNSVTNTQKVARNLEIIPAVDEIISFYTQLGRYDELKNVLEYLAFYCQFLTSSVRANLAQWNSPVQDELMNDFLCKFPDYKSNPYVKSISSQHKLLSFLLMHRLRLSVHVLMKLNNKLKNKQL